jgi:hypothetical protein
MVLMAEEQPLLIDLSAKTSPEIPPPSNTTHSALETLRFEFIDSIPGAYPSSNHSTRQPNPRDSRGSSHVDTCNQLPPVNSNHPHSRIPMSTAQRTHSYNLRSSRSTTGDDNKNSVSTPYGLSLMSWIPLLRSTAYEQRLAHENRELT